MKKTLLFGISMSFAMFSSAQCTELFISKYVCGSGNNKATELFNPSNAAVTLTGVYRLTMYDNGSTTPSASRPLIGTVPAHGTFVLANGQTTTDNVAGPPAYTTPPCDPALQAVAQQLDSAHFFAYSYFNGDDALTLEKKVGSTWVNVDIFGKIGERPTNSSGTFSPSAGWTNVAPYSNGQGKYWTKYHTLTRKAAVMQGVTVNPALFDPSAEYDSLPRNTGYPNGTHACACATGIQEYANNIKVTVYPNPVTGGLLTLVAAQPFEAVEVINVLGAVVASEKGNKQSVIVLNLEALPKGVYFIKSSFDSKSAHLSKIVLQ